MPDARSQILARLKQNSLDSELPAPPRYQPDYGWSREQRIDRFQQMLEAVHGEVHRVTRTDIPDLLQRLLTEKAVSRLLCSKKLTPHLPDKLDGVERFHYDQAIEAWKPALFQLIDASMTTTLGGIAETGSLILWPDQDEPRLMSLVPPIHIALVEADAIYTTFAEVMEKENWKSHMPTNALLISGPSKTADIEQILAYGIHGPKQLIVLLVV